jgi:hypothetical protein
VQRAGGYAATADRRSAASRGIKPVILPSVAQSLFYTYIAHTMSSQSQRQDHLLEVQSDSVDYHEQVDSLETEISEDGIHTRPGGYEGISQ